MKLHCPGQWYQCISTCYPRAFRTICPCAHAHRCTRTHKHTHTHTKPHFCIIHLTKENQMKQDKYQLGVLDIKLLVTSYFSGHPGISECLGSNYLRDRSISKVCRLRDYEVIPARSFGKISVAGKAEQGSMRQMLNKCLLLLIKIEFLPLKHFQKSKSNISPFYLHLLLQFIHS